jgi:hypothetical protein
MQHGTKDKNFGYMQNPKGSDSDLYYPESLGFWTMSTFRNFEEQENTTFRKLDWLAFSMGPNRVSLSTHLKKKGDPFSETLCFLVI